VFFTHLGLKDPRTLRKWMAQTLAAHDAAPKKSFVMK
jgi:hypothetical protein